MAARKDTGQGIRAWVLTAPVLLLALPAWAQTSGSGCTILCASNGGRCTQEANSPRYYCDCAGTGRTGADCQEVTSGMKSSASGFSSSVASPGRGTSACPVPCKNGRCIQLPNSSQYYCACNPGFSGSSCSVAPAPAPSPLASDAANGNGSFTCPVACANGQCLQQLNSNEFYCSCNQGFSGVDCSRASTTAAPVANGSGSYTCPYTCNRGRCAKDPDTGKNSCVCDAGFSGSTCSMASPSSPGLQGSATTSATG